MLASHKKSRTERDDQKKKIIIGREKFCLVRNVACSLSHLEDKLQPSYIRSCLLAAVVAGIRGLDVLTTCTK